MYTSRKGTSSMKCSPIIIMRATQKKRMSKPVTRTDGRVEGLQQRRLVRPAQGRERPERRAEPGVEHVRVLPQPAAAALRAGLRRLLGDDHLAAVLAGPGRDPVAPPDLARDAPVADVLHPVEVGRGPRLGDDARAAVAHRGDGRLGQRLRLHEPLAREVGLDHGLAAVAVADGVPVGLDLLEQPGGFQVLDHGLAALEAVQAREAPGLGRHPAVVADHLHARQVVAQADLEVVRVVGRRDLQAAGAEAHVHVAVADDRDLAPHERQDRPRSPAASR